MMMFSLAFFRTDFVRRTGAVLVALALLLQVMAITLANRHGLAKALWESSAQTIEICSAHGLTSIKVGADGQAAPQSTAECAKCVYCLGALLGWLPLSIAKVGADWLHGTALALPFADHQTASILRVWPPAHAPPAR